MDKLVTGFLIAFVILYFGAVLLSPFADALVSYIKKKSGIDDSSQ